MMDYIKVALEQFNQIMESRDEDSEPFPFDSFEDYFDTVIEPSGRYPELRILRGEPRREFEISAIEIMKAGLDWYNLSEYPDEWFSTVFAPRGWIPEGGVLDVSDAAHCYASNYLPKHGKDTLARIIAGESTVNTLKRHAIDMLEECGFVTVNGDVVTATECGHKARFI